MLLVSDIDSGRLVG